MVVVDSSDIDGDWERDISAAGVVALVCTTNAPGPGPKGESLYTEGKVRLAHVVQFGSNRKQGKAMWCERK